MSASRGGVHCERAVLASITQGSLGSSLRMWAVMKKSEKRTGDKLQQTRFVGGAKATTANRKASPSYSAGSVSSVQVQSAAITRQFYVKDPSHLNAEFILSTSQGPTRGHI